MGPQVEGDLVEGDLVEGDLVEGDLVGGDLAEGDLVVGAELRVGHDEDDQTLWLEGARYHLGIPKGKPDTCNKLED